MTSIRVRATVAIAGVGAFVEILSAATARVSSIDPVAIWEIAGGVTLVVWLALMLRGVAAGARLSAALASASQAAVLHGVQCGVVRDGGRHAFVAGAFRPANCSRSSSTRSITSGRSLRCGPQPSRPGCSSQGCGNRVAQGCSTAWQIWSVKRIRPHYAAGLRTGPSPAPS